jgi:TRAP-type C4-dicarboxylate transport system substrate-binding protein
MLTTDIMTGIISMMKRSKKVKTARILIFCLIALFGISAPAFAQRKQTFKIASVAPENTPWGAALNRMAQEWRTATNGEVELQIYHNGVAGSEEDVLRKLRIGQLQGGVFTSFGLNAITPEVLTLSCPFLIRDNEELDLVLAELRPALEKKIEEKGFVSVAWSKAGWVKIFSKRPVFVPGDLKTQKMGTSASEIELTQAFKTLGYQMVPINMNEILIALNSGMVDAVYQSPIAVGGLQIFGIAKNMASINIAPFLGGIVLSRNAWRSVPEKYKSRLMAINKQIELSLDSSILKLEEEAIATMSTYGLVKNTITPEQERLWYSDVEKTMPDLVGTTFDAATYNQIDRILRAHRAGR